VDFLNARGIEIKKAISEMGFVFRHSGPDGEGKVFLRGNALMEQLLESLLNKALDIQRRRK